LDRDRGAPGQCAQAGAQATLWSIAERAMEVRMDPTPERTELGRVACMQLLASQPVGRVVFTDASSPAALPANYILDGEEMVIRTRADGQLARVTQDRVIAFEISGIDSQTWTRWTVRGA